MRKTLFFALILAPGLLATLVLAGAQAAPRGAPRVPAIPLPQWGPDILISPLARPTISAERNPMFAVRPTNPNFVIAGWDSIQDAQYASGYGGSTDGGRTWAVGVFTNTWGSQQLIPFGNASVAFDGFGTGYYASQALNSTSSGYFVLTTTNALTWSDPLPVGVYDNSQYRSWATLVVDPRTSGPYAGSLYMFWYATQNTQPYYLGILMRYSRDGGHTWGPELRVSDLGHELSYRPFPLVAADGTVLVAFEELDDYYIGNAPKLYLDRSTDGGQTWGGDQEISGAPITPIGRPDYKGRELTLVADPNCQLLRINHFPVIGLAPGNSQTIYATWNDGRWDATTSQCGTPTTSSDIAFSRSTDGGSTWSTPVRVNDAATAYGVDQFEPNLAVHADGTVGIIWYDRRNDPNSYLYDLYYSQSTDGGSTWSANQRVSDVSSNPDAVLDVKGVADLGYRPALAYGTDYALAGWLDTRDGERNGDLYLDHGDIGLVSSTPTATAPPPTSTASATAPPSATAPSPSATLPPPSATLPPPSATAAPPSATPPASATRPPATPSPVPTSTPMPCTVAFSDVHPTDYFYGPVQYLACRGVVSGYGDGTFRPYNQTTRAQLSKLVVNGFGWPIQTPTSPTFADVPASHPFYAFVETALTHGVISGYSCGGPGEPCPGRYFRPGANVTRGQLAKIVVAAKGWAPLTPAAPTFADVPAGNPFYGFVERAYAEGVLSGYSCGGPGEPCPGQYFRPVADSTRGQLSKILYNVLLAP